MPKRQSFQTTRNETGYRSPRPTTNNARTPTRDSTSQEQRYQPAEQASSRRDHPMTYAEVTATPPPQREQLSNPNNNPMQNHFLYPPFTNNHVPHPMMFHQLHSLNNHQLRLPTIANPSSNQR